MTKHEIKWLDRNREPTQPPDPNYPAGRDIVSHDSIGPVCSVMLPYPAKRCGLYIVTCNVCGLKVAITTAGRPDDPRSLTMGCKETLQ